MGVRCSRKRVVLPILVLIGLAGLRPAGRTQDRTRPTGPAGAAKESTRPDVRTEDPALGQLAAELMRFRKSNDEVNAAKVFARLFGQETATDPAAAFKISPAGSGWLQGAAAPKSLTVSRGTSPVFFSADDEKDPSAELWNPGQGPARLVSAAEQGAGTGGGTIGLRSSSDGGRTWTGTSVIGDGRPWTRPVLRQVSTTEIGLAFIREWAAGDGDIFLARLDGDLTSTGEFPVACGPADERNPSIASDYRAFPSPYLYVVYAEQNGATRAVRFKVSPDLGASWSPAVTIATVAGTGTLEIETALAYDPDRNVLQAAFTWPQGSSTGIAVAASRDFGASWSRPLMVTAADGLADRSPRIAAARGQALVVYEHATDGAGSDIGLASSSNAGRTWSTGLSLASTAAVERFPDIRAAEGTGLRKFYASYVEAGSRIMVLSRDAAAAGSWTTEMTFDAGPAVSSGPVAVLPLPPADQGGSAGVFWTSNGPDADVFFSSIHILADALIVTPGNRDVGPNAGRTSFSVEKSGDGDVDWTATVVAGSDWLSIRSGGSGTNAGTITADYDANPDPATRIGAIRVTASDTNIPSVTVTVTQAGVAGLEVTPTDDFLSTGPQGGPFVPASKDYMLRNIGGEALAWSVSDNRNWISTSRTSGNLDPGASDVITVFFTSNADGLGIGAHSGTVTFQNRTNNNGNTTRDVQLTITGTAGSLVVTPANGLVSSGLVGGPFTPASQAYTLQNPGSSPIDWTASTSASAPWVGLSAVSGTLDGGASTTVTVSIGSAADSLSAGVYNDTVTFANATDGTGTTTRPVTLTIANPPGVLSVTPAQGLDSTGPEGGPFTPVSRIYTLSNTGASTLSWTASKTQAWTSLSAGSGTLAVGDTATVTVFINAAAGNLAAGDYTDTVNFVNTSGGGGGTTTRTVSLTVQRGPALVVAPHHRDVPFTGGTATFDVSNGGSGTLTWTAAVVSGSDWLTITSGAGGTDTGTITATAAANRTSNERTGTIRVTAAGAAGSPTDLTVSQVKGELLLSLSGQRMVEKAWIIQREFARLTVSIDNPASVPVQTFVVYRASGSGGEQAVQQVDGATVTGPTLIINDAFIDPGVTYTYRVVAIDVFGSTLAVSNTITIQ